MEWKWTKGEPYERSRRQFRDDTPDIKDVKNNIESGKFSKEIENLAYTSSLNHDENTWDILNQSIANNGFKMSSKREDLDLKIADRDLVHQIGFNPFLNDTNYVEDISIRDQFLKPVNTTFDRVKTTDSSS